MILLDTTETSLRVAAKAILEGLLVAIPTETVYGLGANAFDAAAVAKVFEAKARPFFDPLIVHIASLEDMARAASHISPMAQLLAEKLWPGPLTLILPKRKEIPDIVSSGLDTVAVRFPSHPVARKIIEYSSTVVAAPSANPFGYISPTTADHVVRMLGSKVDYVVDGGKCPVGVESTVIDLTGPLPAVLRLGGMPLEDIRNIAGDIIIPIRKQGPQASPGQLDSHYAPHAPLFLFEAGTLPAIAPTLNRDSRGSDESKNVAIVFDGEAARKLELLCSFDKVFALSKQGDMIEAASRLFALMHDLDEGGCKAIYAERVPDEGLGKAINDRLFRASKKL